MLIKQRLACLALLIVSIAAFPKQGESCAVPPRGFFFESVHSAEVIFKGRIVGDMSHGPIRTFAVEETYKGPHQETWTVIHPLGREHWYPTHARDEHPPSKTELASTSSFLVGIREFGVSRSDKQRKKTNPKLAKTDTKYVVTGGLGGCDAPFFLPFVPRYAIRLAIVLGKNGDERAAKRERLLRRQFGFRTDHYGLCTVYSNARRSASKFYLHKTGSFGFKEIDDYMEIKIHRFRKRLEEWANKRGIVESKSSRALSMRSYRLSSIAPLKKQLRESVLFIDKDGDEIVTQEELFLTIREAFAFYDKNNNGIVDDFEPNEAHEQRCALVRNVAHP